MSSESPLRGLWGRLNPQLHLNPIWGLGEATPGAFAALVAEAVDVAPDAVLAWDLMTHDLTPSTLAGAAGGVRGRAERERAGQEGRGARGARERMEHWADGR